MTCLIKFEEWLIRTEYYIYISFSHALQQALANRLCTEKLWASCELSPKTMDQSLQWLQQSLCEWIQPGDTDGYQSVPSALELGNNTCVSCSLQEHHLVVCIYQPAQGQWGIEISIGTRALYFHQCLGTFFPGQYSIRRCYKEGVFCVHT